MILQTECHPQVSRKNPTSLKGNIMNNISHQKPIAPKFVPTTSIVQDQDQIHHIATSSAASHLMMAESTVSSTVQAAGHQCRGAGNSSGGGGARRKIAFMHPTLGYPIAAPMPAKVQRRNARERNRVKQVNCGFEVLRNHIPSAAKQKKMSKVDTLRHAVEYIEKLQHIVGEQHIDVNVSTCGSPSDQKLSMKEEDPISSTANSSSSVLSVVSQRNIASQNNKPLRQNNRSRNGKNINQRENKSIVPKCASRSNLPPPLIMLPKTNQQSVSPYHQQHHQPSTPSSSSGCSSPSINSPLLGSTNQHSLMNFNQNNNISPNQPNYPPPLTPRTPSNSSGNTNNFCQFMDGSPSPGVGIASTPSIMTNESGYDSMSASFYNSPTSPPNHTHQMAPHPHMIQQSPMRQMPEQQHSSSPMEYHHQNYQQSYQVPCTPPASSIHSHQSLYNSAQHQPNRSSIICESVPPGMDESFHLNASSSQGHLNTENASRFGFDYAAHSTEEDELLDVIAKWQEN